MTKRKKQIKRANEIDPKELITYLENPNKNKSMASRRYGVSVGTIDRIVSQNGRPDMASPSIANRYVSTKEREFFNNPTNVERLRKDAIKDFLTKQLKELS